MDCPTRVVQNSEDQTQESVIKMLNLGGGSDMRTNIMGLNIVPVSISYEYDPCDYLKAKEYQMKRDNPDYKKQPQDDLFSNRMRYPVYMYIHFHLSPVINGKLKNWKIVEIRCVALYNPYYR